MSVKIIIPVRYVGTRMQARPLLDETGWPLIRHVYELARKVEGVDEVIVATDDIRVQRIVEGFGGICVLSGSQHKNGSERVYEVARQFSDDDIIVNIQGDEPEFEPKDIEKLIHLHQQSQADITSAAVPFSDEGPKSGHLSPMDPNSVKVITTGLQSCESIEMNWGQAIYFSRSLMPYSFIEQGEVHKPSDYLLHSGIYVYSVAKLAEFNSLPMGDLEEKEKLEQLRGIENSFKIIIGIQSNIPAKINTLEDYQSFVVRWNSALA